MRERLCFFAFHRGTLAGGSELLLVAHFAPERMFSMTNKLVNAGKKMKSTLCGGKEKRERLCFFFTCVVAQIASGSELLHIVPFASGENVWHCLPQKQTVAKFNAAQKT